MNIQIGEKVKFLNDVGGGTIVKFIDKKTAMVLTDEGFEFPFAIKELIKIEETPNNEFFKASSSAQKQEKPKTLEDVLSEEEEIITKDNEETNIYLAFVPQDATQPTSSRQNLRIINDSNWHLMYVYQIRRNRNFESFPGILQPNYVEELKTFSLQEINEIKEIVVQLIFFRKIPYDIKDPVIKLITIKPQKFYDASSFKKNDYFEQKAIIFPVVEENPLKNAVEKLKKSDVKNIVYQKEVKNQKENEHKKAHTKPKQTQVEVDLHINALLDNTKGMEAKDILDYQIKIFKEELSKAQKSHTIKKIVFIHGKGNGSLKAKLRSYLDRNKINYQDASFQKYGFGATLIFV